MTLAAVLTWADRPGVSPRPDEEGSAAVVLPGLAGATQAQPADVGGAAGVDNRPGERTRVVVPWLR